MRPTVHLQAEAEWIEQTLARDGESLAEVDLLLTGANGWPWLDHGCREVAEALSGLAGRPIACGAYKHCCGEYASASAFGLLTAIGLVRGIIEPAWCLATAMPLPDPSPPAPSPSPSARERGSNLREGAPDTRIAPQQRVEAGEGPACRGATGSPRRVVLYTVSPKGGRSLCCVSA